MRKGYHYWPAPSRPSTDKWSIATGILRRSSWISHPLDRYGFTGEWPPSRLHPYPNPIHRLCNTNVGNRLLQELNVLEKNHTWDIVDCPSTIKPIGWKWIYSIKLKLDGSSDRHKVRLVALGNKQEYRIAYEETFGLVSKMISVGLLLAIAGSRCCPLYQMDVTIFFLHSNLKEEVYMQVP